MNDSRNGNGSTIATLTTSQPNAEYNETFTVSNPTRFGYIFTGWTISGMDTSSHIIGETTTTSITATGVKATEFCNLRIDSKEKVIFSANWAPITYEVIINRNGGGDTYTTTATFDQAFTVNTPTRDLYNFTGWNITGMSTDVIHHYGSNTTTASQISKTTETSFLNLHSVQDAEVTFTAQWESAHKCNIVDVVTESWCVTPGATIKECLNKTGTCPLGPEYKKTTGVVDALGHLSSSSGGSKGTCNQHHHVDDWLCSPATITTSNKTVEHALKKDYPGCFDPNVYHIDCSNQGCTKSGDYYTFTGRNIIHCARRTATVDVDGYSVKNGAYYYCGKDGQSWCSTSLGTTRASVVFKCVCTSKAAGSDNRHPATEIVWISSDYGNKTVWLDMFLGNHNAGVFKHDYCNGYICFNDTLSGITLKKMNPYGTITIMPNGGTIKTNGSTAETTIQYYRNGFELPIITRTNYSFDGWYCQETGEEFDAGTVFATGKLPNNASYTKLSAGSYTFTAMWTYTGSGTGTLKPITPGQQIEYQ